MLLLLTNSADLTGDLIAERMQRSVFRLNFDLFAHYALAFTPEGWRIESPAGHIIASDSVTGAFWWKAFQFPINGHDDYVTEEVKYVFRELYGWCRMRGLAKGNPPDFHHHLGKINLLGIARRFFQTPKTLVTFGLSGLACFGHDRVVAKSLASRLIGSGSALYTTEVVAASLDPGYPWFLQDLVHSDADLTVFSCGSRLFAFERSRAHLDGLDWRAGGSAADDLTAWVPIQLAQHEAMAVTNFLAAIDVNWGRCDLMRSTAGTVFLEFNANGQWAFLDRLNEAGLADAVVDYLRP